MNRVVTGQARYCISQVSKSDRSHISYLKAGEEGKRGGGEIEGMGGDAEE